MSVDDFHAQPGICGMMAHHIHQPSIYHVALTRRYWSGPAHAHWMLIYLTVSCSQLWPDPLAPFAVLCPHLLAPWWRRGCHCLRLMAPARCIPVQAFRRLGLKTIVGGKSMAAMISTLSRPHLFTCLEQLKRWAWANVYAPLKFCELTLDFEAIGPFRALANIKMMFAFCWCVRWSSG